MAPTGVLTFLGISFLFDGPMPFGDGEVVVTWADVVGWALSSGLVVTGVMFPSRAATSTGNRWVPAAVGAPFSVAAVVGLFAPRVLVDDETVLVGMSRSVSVAAGAALLAGSAALLWRGQARPGGGPPRQVNRLPGRRVGPGGQEVQGGGFRPRGGRTRRLSHRRRTLATPTA